MSSRLSSTIVSNRRLEVCGMKERLLRIISKIKPVVNKLTLSFDEYFQCCTLHHQINYSHLCPPFLVKRQVLPYSLLSVGPGADPGVQVVSPQVTFKLSLSGRLPLLSARPAVTFPAEQRHRLLTSTKLYCLVTEAHRCEQLAQGCYAAELGENRTHDLMIASSTLYRCRLTFLVSNKNTK